ncbi:MAG: hypothetical protein VKP62_12700 [Candidatus Sericytochromatia bacterium]|nr:hypothetical protein [Candidatus Sericytochromatia bacterium]
MQTRSTRANRSSSRGRQRSSPLRRRLAISVLVGAGVLLAGSQCYRLACPQAVNLLEPLWAVLGLLLLVAVVSVYAPGLLQRALLGSLAGGLGGVSALGCQEWILPSLSSDPMFAGPPGAPSVWVAWGLGGLTLGFSYGLWGGRHRLLWAAAFCAVAGSLAFAGAVLLGDDTSVQLTVWLLLALLGGVMGGVTKRLQPPRGAKLLPLAEYRTRFPRPGRGPRAPFR